jgi:sarcosine oxidase
MPSAIVIGAGVFGASLVDRLARAGWEVTLVDRFEPGHPRAESGGETRLIRCSHGPDDFYARSARRAIELWRELGEGVLVESGVSWFARREDGWEAASERVLREAGVPAERISPGEAARMFPSLAVDDLAFVLHEPEAGVLRAADGVRALVRRAREAGARVVTGEARPDGERVRLTAVGGAGVAGGAPGGSAGGAAVGCAAADGGAEWLEADVVVWACGAWLGRLFPELVPLRVTFQQLVLFEAPPEWDGPGWVDFDAAFYGHARVEGIGFKVGPDMDGVDVDPDTRPSPSRGSTSPTASRPSRTLPSRARPAATTASPPTASSCLPPIGSKSRTGSSAAGPATATSTGRRWPSTPRRCSPAASSPSPASPWASAPRSEASGRRAPSARAARPSDGSAERAAGRAGGGVEPP